jgi:hypothetical protein
VTFLFAFNVALQLWDGVATYYGLSLGVQEGNPLLRHGMESWGVEWTLLGAKSTACLFLLYLHSVAHLSVSVWGLAFVAVSYFVGSFVPWLLVLFVV